MSDHARDRVYPAHMFCLYTNNLPPNSKLPPTTTPIMLLMLLDEKEVLWLTEANGRTAIERSRDLAQRGRALPQGQAEAGQTCGRTPTVIPDSSVGVI